MFLNPSWLRIYFNVLLNPSRVLDWRKYINIRSQPQFVILFFQHTQCSTILHNELQQTEAVELLSKDTQCHSKTICGLSALFFHSISQQELMNVSRTVCNFSIHSHLASVDPSNSLHTSSTDNAIPAKFAIGWLRELVWTWKTCKSGEFLPPRNAMIILQVHPGPNNTVFQELSSFNSQMFQDHN